MGCLDRWKDYANRHIGSAKVRKIRPGGVCRTGRHGRGRVLRQEWVWKVPGPGVHQTAPQVYFQPAAVVLLVLAAFAPRILQLVHPEGQYHALTLTAYAVLIAGAVMIVIRGARTLTRNAAIIVTVFLVAGYVMQCNWISTVNYLNTFAHFDTLTQVLARLRSLPDAGWDGKKIVVVGRYEMPTTYPFATRDAVAPKFLDAQHMTYMARLLRDEATFVSADTTMPRVLEYARSHPPWPNPASVTIVDGMGVVVLSNAAPPKDSQ